MFELPHKVRSGGTVLACGTSGTDGTVGVGGTVETVGVGRTVGTVGMHCTVLLSGRIAVLGGCILRLGHVLEVSVFNQSSKATSYNPFSSHFYSPLRRLPPSPTFCHYKSRNYHPMYV